MSGNRSRFRRKREEGIIIILAAVFMLFVMGAMAALSIDVVTFYAARSEAQIAADSAALAGARVLANSGMTTDPSITSNAITLATNVATQVAQQNQIGGSTPTVSVNITHTTQGNPYVTVRVSRSDLPTFFARIWGSNTITTAASATAEAYNPSGTASISGTTIPVAPACVKPFVLPNLDPSGTSSNGKIFDQTSGVIQPTGLLGWESGSGSGATRLHALCSGTTSVCPPATPHVWQYYKGTDIKFAASQALPACAPPSAFQKSVAGCAQTPIACGSVVNIDSTYDSNLDLDAANAVDCLTNTSGGKGDQMNLALAPPAPFEFIAGDDNPLVQAGVLTSNANVMVSDSLVTVPIFDNSTWGSTPPPSVQVIGFVQLFLQPSGHKVPVGGVNALTIRTKVINIVGCGTSTTGTPVVGNGSSAVPVRLITPPPPG